MSRNRRNPPLKSELRLFLEEVLGLFSILAFGFILWVVV